MKRISLVLALFSIVLSACGGASSIDSSHLGAQLPQTGAIEVPSAPSCTSSDPNHQCIGLKLVSFIDASGNPVMNQEEALRLVQGINDVWRSCNIAFQLEKFSTVNPADQQLQYSPNWKTEAGKVRAAYEEAGSFLVVAVGDLGGSTIAVTQMPGNGPHGVLFEKTFSKNAFTVGHELGHYQGLLHIRNKKNLMSPYIGPNTSSIQENQCAYARKTNLAYWPRMMRHL